MITLSLQIDTDPWYVTTLTQSSGNCRRDPPHTSPLVISASPTRRATSTAPRTASGPLSTGQSDHQTDRQPASPVQPFIKFTFLLQVLLLFQTENPFE